MIQDIYPHRFNNQYDPEALLAENDYIVHFKGNTLLFKKTVEGLTLPRKSDVSNLTLECAPVFLFRLNETACFLIEEEPCVDEASFTYSDLEIFRYMKEQEVAWMCLSAYQLYTWYTRNQFCGTCGGKTHHKHDERAMVCSVCSTIHYPTIAPAVIVAILCGDHILLVRGGKNTHGRYSLVSGFVEVGETLEEAVVREVKEETGLDVHAVRYYKNQPWPLSGSMMIGFIAEADKNQPLVLDQNELGDAAWFSRDNLPNHSLSLSIAGEMIEQFEKCSLK